MKFFQTVFKDFWFQIYKKVRKKGGEHLTLMIVPHSSSKIFHLQLSKAALFFVFLLLILIPLVSVLSLQNQTNINPEIEGLYSIDDTFSSERQQYIENFEKIYAAQKSVQTLLKDIIHQINGERESRSTFLTHNEINEKASQQMEQESKEFYLYMSKLLEKRNETGFSFGKLKDILLADFEKYNLNKSFRYNSDVLSYRKLNLKVQQNINALLLLESFLSQERSVRKNLPYSWPIAGGHITSRYGPRYSPFGYLNEFHLGVDLADVVGTPIYAAAEGLVDVSGYRGGYGLTVKISHRFGYRTLYAHMSSVLVRAGQYVKKGQPIGRIGQTGRATGPHLHFEVKLGEKHINPMPFLKRL